MAPAADGLKDPYPENQKPDVGGEPIAIRWFGIGLRDEICYLCIVSDRTYECVGFSQKDK
jgi:hypothetical protein